MFLFPARNDIQNAGVQYVLDSVIPELVSDPSKRFIYVEIAFFARWWREQHDSMRHMVKGLVNSGIYKILIYTKSLSTLVDISFFIGFEF